MKVLVTGAGGAIGGHLIQRLAKEFGAANITATDVKAQRDWWQAPPPGAVVEPERDLTDRRAARNVCYFSGWSCVFHLAANMGGMSFIGTKDGDRAAMLENVCIDRNVFDLCVQAGTRRLVYASSACVYNETFQGERPLALVERMAWPALPDTMYGLEKLFAEKMLDALRSETFNPVAVRFHNVLGTHGSWRGGKEKFPAAICRKVAEAKRDGRNEIELIGDGEQTRSYLAAADCVEGLLRIAADATIQEPINLGTDRSISVNDLATMVEGIAGHPCVHRHVAGPQGVRNRNADISLLRKRLGWEPPTSLEAAMEDLYRWVEGEVSR